MRRRWVLGGMYHRSSPFIHQFASFFASSSDSTFSFSSSWLFLLAADKQTKCYTRGSSHRCSLPRVWTAKR